MIILDRTFQEKFIHNFGVILAESCAVFPISVEFSQSKTSRRDTC